MRLWIIGGQSNVSFMEVEGEITFFSLLRKMEKWYSGSRCGMEAVSSERVNGGSGCVLVFDSSSVRNANHGRGRNGMSHSFSFNVLV